MYFVGMLLLFAGCILYGIWDIIQQIIDGVRASERQRVDAEIRSRIEAEFLEKDRVNREKTLNRKLEVPPTRLEAEEIFEEWRKEQRRLKKRRSICELNRRNLSFNRDFWRWEAYFYANPSNFTAYLKDGEITEENPQETP